MKILTKSLAVLMAIMMILGQTAIFAENILTNIALESEGKATVSASSSDQTNVISNANDGNLTTFWQVAATGAPTPGGYWSNEKWFKISLDKGYVLTSIDVAFSHCAGGYKILAGTTDDMSSATVVYATTTETTGSLIKHPVTAKSTYQYIWVENVNYNSWLGINEINVMADLDNQADPYEGLTNIAPLGVATAPLSKINNADVATYANDGKEETAFVATENLTNADDSHYLQIELDKPYIIKKIEYVGHQSWSFETARSYFNIKASKDAGFNSHSLLAEYGIAPNGPPAFPDKGTFSVNNVPQEKYQYVRIEKMANGGKYLGVGEIKIWVDLSNQTDPYEELTNIAIGKTIATCDGNFQQSSVWVDDNMATDAHLATYAGEKYIQLDLGSPYILSKIELFKKGEFPERMRRMDIYLTNTPLADGEKLTSSSETNAMYDSLYHFAATGTTYQGDNGEFSQDVQTMNKYRYVIIRRWTAEWSHLSEIKIWANLQNQLNFEINTKSNGTGTQILGDLTANATVYAVCKASATTERNANIYIVLYDDKDKIVDVSISPQTMDENSPNVIYNGQITLPDVVTGYYLKAFFWDDSMIPVIEDITTQNVTLELYVSNSGMDTNKGSLTAPFSTLQKAISVAKTLTANTVNINITGTYNAYTAIENQSNKKINIIGDNATISGGETVSLTQEGDFYVANIDTPYITELYIDGKKAKISRSTTKITAESYYKNEADTAYELDGLVIAKSKLPLLTNPRDVTMHWGTSWRNLTMKVDNITESGDNYIFHMAQNMFQIQAELKSWNASPFSPFYVENAKELCESEGEFYYDKIAKKLFYKPYANEVPQEASYAIKSDSLLNINNASNVTIKNVNFIYNKFDEAEQYGMTSSQGNGLVHLGYGANTQIGKTFTSAMIGIRNSNEVVIEDCRFTNSGTCGVGIYDNTNDISVIGNTFADIKSSAITVGLPDSSINTSTHIIPNNIRIENNYITRVGTDFWAAPAIDIYYTKNSTVHNNEIDKVPYSGISIGWGWGDSSYPMYDSMSNNSIKYNKITNYLMQNFDGGGIYLLGSQPGSVIEENYIANGVNPHGAIYPDQGSANFKILGNVMDTQDATIFIWTDKIYNIVASGNYATNKNQINNGTNCTLEDLTTYLAKFPTDTVNKIINNAGLLAGYANIKQKIQDSNISFDKEAKEVIHTLWTASKMRDYLLVELINYAQTMYDVSENPVGYTTNGRTALNSAIANATTIKNKADLIITKTEVKKALLDLQTAIDTFLNTCQ